VSLTLEVVCLAADNKKPGAKRRAVSRYATRHSAMLEA